MHPKMDMICSSSRNRINCRSGRTFLTNNRALQNTRAIADRNSIQVRINTKNVISVIDFNVISETEVTTRNAETAPTKPIGSTLCAPGRPDTSAWPARG